MWLLVRRPALATTRRRSDLLVRSPRAAHGAATNTLVWLSPVCSSMSASCTRRPNASWKDTIKYDLTTYDAHSAFDIERPPAGAGVAAVFLSELAVARLAQMRAQYICRLHGVQSCGNLCTKNIFCVANARRAMLPGRLGVYDDGRGIKPRLCRRVCVNDG